MTNGEPRKPSAKRSRDSGASSARTDAENQAHFVERGLMRVIEVRDITGMSLPEVYRCCHSGIFRFRRMSGGRGILVYRASVEQFIAEGLKESA